MNITDINDNAPVWSPTELHKEFAESDREGIQSFKDLEMATDRDTGRNGEVKYTITGVMAVLTLAQTNDVRSGGAATLGGDGTPLSLADFPFQLAWKNSQLGLVVKGSLDRERVRSYEFLLVATDKGPPPLSSNISVFITILGMAFYFFSKAFPQCLFSELLNSKGALKRI